MEAAVAQLSAAIGKEIAIEVDTGYESQSLYMKLDDKAKAKFQQSLHNFVVNGLAGKSKEALITYLALSAPARARFANAVSKIVVEVSPPSKLKSNSVDLQVDVNDVTQTITAICKLQALIDNKVNEGWGAKIDASMGLCVLTDGYIEKARLVQAQTIAECGAHVAGLQGEIDFTFVDELPYKKLAEDVRQRLVASAGTAFKAGMLSLAKYLARSARATKVFQGLIQSVQLWVSVDNKCKAPFELLDVDGVLRIGVSQKSLDAGALPSWGAAADERFNLQIIEEEGIKQCENAALQYAQALPIHRIDFDWSIMLTDKWRKMKPEERQSCFTSIVKKTLASGVNDRKEGLGGYLQRSPRARQLFASKIGVVRVKLEAAGKPQPMLLDGGILVVPALLTNLDGAQSWGVLADQVLGLRVEEEEALRKALTTIDKLAGGFPVTVDWASFMEDPALLRAATEKRLAVISGFLPLVQVGLSGKQGLMGLGTTLTDHVDSLVIRCATAVKAKGIMDIRYGGDRILEVTFKTAALTSANSNGEPWGPIFSALKGPDGAGAVVPQAYHLLGDGDPNVQCLIDAAPTLAPILAGADDLYSSTPLAVSGTTASAPSIKDIAAPPVAKAPPPVAKAPPSATPPVARSPAPAPKVAPSPVTPKAAPSPAPVPAKAPVAASPVVAKAPVPSSVPDSVPADFGCPAIWPQIDQQVKVFAKQFDIDVSFDIDWTFMAHNSFNAQNDAQKKAVITNINARVFTPLLQGLAKVGKMHALYQEAVKTIRQIIFAFEGAENVMDLTAGKQGKTYYTVSLNEGVLKVACNLSSHMAGIGPNLEPKLQLVCNCAHLIAVEEAQIAIKKLGDQNKIVCYLDPAYAEHASYLKPPGGVSIDTIQTWSQVGKEAATGLDRLLKAIDASNKDPIFAAEFKSRFSSILVRPDPTNSVRDMLSPASWCLIEDKEQFQLVLKYNMNDGGQAGQVAPPKLVPVIDVRLAQAVFAARKDAQEQMQKLRMTLPTAEMVLIDFFEQDAFKKLHIDKQLEGCKSLKLFLGGAIKQLGTVQAKNAAVVKEKLRIVEFGLEPASTIRGADSEVTLDNATGTLRMVQNMNSANRPDPTIQQRIDLLLDVTMSNVESEVVLEMKTRSAALATALQIPGFAISMDMSFQQDPAFATLQPQVKQAKVRKLRKDVELVCDTLTKFGPKDCVGLVAVQYVIDGSNPINDPFHGATDADHYYILLDKDGLMRITINIDAIDKPLGRVAHKLEQQLAILRARNKPYHNGVEFFDWETLRYPPLLNDVILPQFELSLLHCYDIVRTFAKSIEDSRKGSPPGAQALARISTFVVRMAHVSSIRNLNWEIINPEPDTLVLVVSFDYVKDRQALQQLKWKEALEWTLGSTVEVEKFHCLDRIAKAEALLKAPFGRDVPITLDWPTYIDTPEFLELDAFQCREHIRMLSKQLMVQVVQAMVAVGGHPVGQRVMREKVKSLFISYGPNVDMSQRLRQPAKMVVEPNGRLLITLRHLAESLRLDYKLRLEFELDAIVAVAVHDFTARRKAVSAKLGNLAITDNIAQFTALDEFRYGIDTLKQRDVIEAVVAQIPEHVLVNNPADGMLGVWDRAASKTKGFRVTISVNTKEGTTVNGTLTLGKDGILDLNYDLGVVFSVPSSVNWRPRIADVLGFMDELGQEECNAKLALTTKELALVPVSIDWKSFVMSPQWLELPSSDRYERMHNFGGEYARDVLLGYWGLTGLMFFGPVKNELLKRIKVIELAVDPAAAKLPYKVALNGTTLRLTFCLDDLKTGVAHTGCRERVEATMKLRPLIEDCAKQEQIDKHVTPVSRELKKPITINWDFMKNQDYLLQRDYVAYLRYVGSMIEPLLIGYRNLEGIPWMLKRNRQASEFYASTLSIEVRVDGDCTTRPPQDRFVNGFLNCELVDKDLFITVRRDWMELKDKNNGEDSPDSNQVHGGCGSNLEYLFDPENSAVREENWLRQFEEQLRENEKQRRADEHAAWERECQRLEEDFNDYMEKYHKAAQKSCWSCKGRRCHTCKNTGTEQGRMAPPRKEVAPGMPQFPPIDDTPWYDLAVNHTRFKEPAKLPIVIDEQPGPTRPTFTPIHVRWSKTEARSIGGESKRPTSLARSPLPSAFGYPPLSIETPPAGVQETVVNDPDYYGKVPNAPSGGKVPQAPSASDLKSALQKKKK